MIPSARGMPDKAASMLRRDAEPPAGRRTASRRAVVYGGTDTLETSHGLVVGYRDVGMLLDDPKRQGDAGQSGFDASA